MKRISARYLLQFTTAQLWDMLVGDFRLLFDNGEEITTNYRQTLYSSYFWDFHREYPNTPLLPRHHVQWVIGNKPATSKTHIELLGLIYWNVAETYQLLTPFTRDHLTKRVYEVTNRLYCDLAKRAEAFVVSIDILDFIQASEHPEIKEAYGNLSEKRSTIAACYAKIMEVLGNDPNMADNAVARAVRAKSVRASQLLQCVGVRGYVTEVDGMILPVPVLSNYVKGMRRLYDYAAESRTAAKSLYFSETPLQDAEYFARRLQLLAMSVERLHHGDCGSTNYIDWRIKPPVYKPEVSDDSKIEDISDDEGDLDLVLSPVKGGVMKMVYPGDLQFMVGKFYLDEESGELKILKESDTHLYGKYIKMRSVLTCQHEDEAGVCSTCFGDMAQNVSPDANLGHVCAATMTQQTSQSVLSTKHEEASSTAEPVSISEVGRRFFTAGKDGSSYLLRKDLRDTGIMMLVSQEEAYGLTDIALVTRVEELNVSRVSEIDYVFFDVMEKDVLVRVPVCVSQQGRFPTFTHEFLAYLKQHRWQMDDSGSFKFDLQHWDFSKPVMRLPETEYSYAQHSSQIAKMIESRMKDIGDRLKPESPTTTLVELFDLVNAKLNVNIALLETIIYTSMVANGADMDFGLARGSENASLGVAEMTIYGRSLGAAYTYERQSRVSCDPASFYPLNRPDSVFDVFIAPKQVLEALPA